MTVQNKTGAPADAEYSALCVRRADLARAAGTFLGQALHPDTQNPDVARGIAEDFAREYNDVTAQMRAWRLANGWEK